MLLSCLLFVLFLPQVEDAELLQLLASSLKPRKSSKKKAAAKTDAAAVEAK